MIDVVGILGWPSPGALARVEAADVIVAGERLLALASAAIRSDAATITIGGDVGAATDAIASAVNTGSRVCVLASGDPGWFGIVRALAGRFGREALRVSPATSSVSEAFARLSMPWDDAVVVSAHGRPGPDAARLAARSSKAAVLTSPECPPNVLGASLLELGATHQHAAVCARLGLPDEQIDITDLGGLAAGAWHPLAIVVLWSGSGVAPAKSLAWGLPESVFAHRGAMITKSEVRAVVIGLLSLPAPSVPAPVLWDVGAGSGSVAIECARVAPWIEAVAVERNPSVVETLVTNARMHDAPVRVVMGLAPSCLDDLPDPDRVFVGGGGLSVLSAARARLRPGGVVVATHAAIDRAAAAASILGNLVEVGVSRGRQLPDGGWRLEGANPVFVTWGGPPAP